MDCFKDKDLNPLTCRFSKKCKEGYKRNEVFQCRKRIKPKLKKTLKKSNTLHKQPSSLSPNSKTFDIPSPIDAPYNVAPVVNKIKTNLDELSRIGKEKGAVHFIGYVKTLGIGYVAVLNKFKGECIPIFEDKYTKEMHIELSINTKKKYTHIFNSDYILEQFGKSLKKCIDRNISVICIFLYLRFDNKSDGHQNLLIYRPFERIIERFEPHGKLYGNDIRDNLNINAQLTELFEVKLNPYTNGRVRFFPPNEICPYYKGFQTLEEQIKGLSIEGTGFCTMWSLFVMEMILNNPSKSTLQVIEEVMHITNKDPEYLKDIIRGYVVGIEQILDKTMKMVNKPNFSFEKTPLLDTNDKVIQEFILNSMFETEKDIREKKEYKSLPKSIEKMDELWINMLDKFDENELIKMFLSDHMEKSDIPTTKHQIIYYIKENYDSKTIGQYIDEYSKLKMILHGLTKEELLKLIIMIHGKKLKFNKIITKYKMVSYILNTYDIDTIKKHIEKEESMEVESIQKYKEELSRQKEFKRVFPLNSEDTSEDGKDYIVFQDGGTGIMLADTLYKDGTMISLSKQLSKKFLQPPNGWYLSEKYDGLRGIWTGKELVARPTKKNGVLKGKVFNYVPKWFINMLPPGVSLDGEIWMGRGRFQEVSGLSNLKLGKKITEQYLDAKWKDVKFMVFDLPNSKKPYVERKDELKKIIDEINIKQGKDCPIQMSNYTIVKDNLTELYTEYTLNGAEGIVLREPDSLYETKRSKLLLKMKLSDDAEAIVVGYVPGTNKYKGLLGSLICEINGNKFNIGTGFNDLMRKEYNDPHSVHYIPIGSKVNFGYMEMTKYGIPRHPVYRGIRTDI
jgi:DNA ligase 1